MSKSAILEEPKIGRIIRRLAYEIYENNIDSNSMVFVGVDAAGHDLGELIGKELNEIHPEMKSTFHLLDMDKANPKDTLKWNGDIPDLEGRNVVLVDDVLNTGKTIAYSLAALLELSPAKIEVAVLVDRGHRTFPVSATYLGYELATTLEDHIEVNLGNKSVVYLY